MWVCRECGSKDVQELVPTWYDMNSGRVLDYEEEQAGYETSCPDCGDPGGMGILEIDDEAEAIRKEFLEGHWFLLAPGDENEDVEKWPVIALAFGTEPCGSRRLRARVGRAESEEGMKRFRELETRVKRWSTEAPITNHEAAVEFMRQQLGPSLVETFAVVLVDGRHRPIAFHLVSMGTQTSTLVHPREVFRLAVAEAACGVIVFHNHPSGDPSPSGDDRAVTDRLVQAGQLIGIPVLDHIIVSAGGTYSFKNSGAMFHN